MDKYQLYLFDFDGTLFDTLTCSKWVFRNAYKQIGIELKEEDVLSLTRDTHFPQFFIKISHIY